jgi:hypothetical protein
MLANRSNFTSKEARRRAAVDHHLQSRAIAEKLEQKRRDRAGRTISFWDWAMKVPEPKAGPLNFRAFPFQKELYKEAEHDKEMVVQKATQIGLSAWAIRWALYHADTKGRTGLYVFPTQRDMWDFSSLRIKPTIDGSDYLRSRQSPDDPDNKGMKGVGLGVVVFRGSESKRGLDSVDCDHIVFDEYDTLDHANIPDAEMRVSSPLSPGLIRRIGVPSVPDWGIGKAYDESDQRRWNVKCGRCGEWQELDFWKNVDHDALQRICVKCHKSIEEDIEHGMWVAKYPDRRVRGYHVSRLIVPGANLAAIIKKSKDKSPSEQTVFFTKHLGIPYANAEGRLSKEALQAAQTAGGGYVQAPGYSGSNLVTMGVDVASSRNLNVRVSEHFAEDKKRALFIGEVSTFDELDSMMRRFQVNMCAIDHLPDGRLARAFAERFPGMVYLVSYDSTPNPKDSQVLKVDEDMRHVRVRRVEAIDATFEMIRSQRNHLPLDLPDDYVSNLQTLNRVVEEDELGKKTVVYKRMGPADDYAHAEVYDLVATEVWWLRQGLDELQREEFKPLEEMLEFQRSDIGDYDRDIEYNPGRERDYFDATDPFADPGQRFPYDG